MRGLEITELQEMTTLLEGDELLVIVVDPDGVPINKKIVIGGTYLTSAFPIPEQIMFTVPGALAVGDDQAPWFICGVPTGLTLISTIPAVKTAPSSSSIRVDIQHSGNCGRDWSSIYSTRPNISSGNKCGTGGSLSTTYIEQGSILRLDIDQVGSSVAGADLTVSLQVEQSVGVTTSTSTTTLTSTSTSTSISTSTATLTSTSTSTATGTTTTTLAWQSPVAVYSVCGDYEATPASDFIDGDTGSYWSHLTDEDHEIILDLGESKKIAKIRMWVYGLAQSQWSFFTARVSLVPFSWPAEMLLISAGAFEGAEFGPEWVENSTWDKTGRYLRLHSIHTEHEFHHLMGAEFQVYAS